MARLARVSERGMSPAKRDRETLAALRKLDLSPPRGHRSGAKLVAWVAVQSTKRRNGWADDLHGSRGRKKAPAKKAKKYYAVQRAGTIYFGSSRKDAEWEFRSCLGYGFRQVRFLELEVVATKVARPKKGKRT